MRVDMDTACYQPFVRGLDLAPVSHRSLGHARLEPRNASFVIAKEIARE